MVHLYGYVADMPAIMELAHAHNILVIRRFQAIGADIGGRKAGSFLDLASFPSIRTRILPPLAKGACSLCTTKSTQTSSPCSATTAIAPSPANAGLLGACYGQPGLPELNGEMLWPNNYCLGEVECALGAKQLDRVDLINAEKQERALAFIDALAEYPELVFHRVDSSRHNYHLLVARMDGTVARRDDFIRRMYNEHGIKCVVQYYPLNRYPFYQRLGLGTANCPNADTFYDHMISFPFQHNLTVKEFDTMLHATKIVVAAQRQQRW